MKLTSLLKNLQVTPKISLVDELIQIRASNLQPSSKGISNYYFSSIPQTIIVINIFSHTVFECH